MQHAPRTANPTYFVKVKTQHALRTANHVKTRHAPCTEKPGLRAESGLASYDKRLRSPTRFRLHARLICSRIVHTTRLHPATSMLLSLNTSSTGCFSFDPTTMPQLMHLASVLLYSRTMPELFSLASAPTASKPFLRLHLASVFQTLLASCFCPLLPRFANLSSASSASTPCNHFSLVHLPSRITVWSILDAPPWLPYLIFLFLVQNGLPRGFFHNYGCVFFFPAPSTLPGFLCLFPSTLHSTRDEVASPLYLASTLSPHHLVYLLRTSSFFDFLTYLCKERDDATAQSIHANPGLDMFWHLRVHNDK